jgi:N-acetylmannosamine-6-phosphate 2-epimerase/N-acetylmannosamine kinase
MDSTSMVVAFALAAIDGGAAGVRIEGVERVRAVRAATNLPIIGLVKRAEESTKVIITPRQVDVAALVEVGADIIAFDATDRARPEAVAALSERVHQAGRLAMADIATFAEARSAQQAGCKIIGTTLSGYTVGMASEYADISLVKACAGLGAAVFAEGRYRTVEDVTAAVRAGAWSVVVGSAVTRPEHITAWFAKAMSKPLLPTGPSRRPSRRPVLAIDLGGSKILAALIDGDQILDLGQSATPRDKGLEAWLDALVDLVAPWGGRYSVAGAALTGCVREGLWSALNPATLPVPPNFPIVTTLSERLGVPVVARNDAQAAAWGEYRCGAGRGRDMVFVTISTGIGGGIVLGGRLIAGRQGLAGHIGVGPVETREGETLLETIGSGAALTRLARGRGHAVDAPAVVAAANAGAVWAGALLDAVVAPVARRLQALQLELDPDVFIIGGGLGLAPGYLDRLCAAHASVATEFRPDLRAAALGPNAGLIGIADLALSSTSSAFEENR